MAVTTAPSQGSGPTVLDALSLLSEVTDELVVRSVRDTHIAILSRVQRFTHTSGYLHRGIAGAVYGGLGLALRAASTSLDRAASATSTAPRLEDHPRGRFVTSAVNG